MPGNKRKQVLRISLGAGCREFEPLHSDHKKSNTFWYYSFYFCSKLFNFFTFCSQSRFPALGYKHDRRQWRIQGVLIGVAVKIVRCEQRANNFGHRKRRRSRGCRGFKSLHLDHENPCKLKVYKGFSLFIKPSKITICDMFSTSQVETFFVFKPVPYSLTYAVKFFISTKGKKG